MLGPASERAASFARHLPETGWEPIVVTVKRGLFHRDLRNRPPPVRTLRTRSPEPGRALRAVTRGRRHSARLDDEAVRELSGGVALDRVRRLVRDYVYVPDALAPWIPFAIAGARRAVRTAPAPAVLISTSVPYSAHLAARAVARSERIPWVAELRDPWSLMDDRVRPRSRARKAIDGALERRVVAAASAVVVTSELTREAMVRAYPSLDSRTWVVRNGFEPLPGPMPSAPDQTERLELVQAGTVGNEIALAPLLRGIDRVARERPGEIGLRVVGPSDRWRAAAGEVGGLDWLTLDGVVDPATAQRAVAGASATVLLRPGEANRRIVAAKLMDYVGARRPVVGIIWAGGEMARLAADYGDLRLVDPYTEEGVAAAVEALLAEHREGLLERPVDSRRPLAELTRRAQTAKLAAVLESVL